MADATKVVMSTGQQLNDNWRDQLARAGGCVSQMTLRDHFAGLAMQALLTHPQIAEDADSYPAQRAYKMADAMLAQRSITTKGNQ